MAFWKVLSLHLIWAFLILATHCSSSVSYSTIKIDDRIYAKTEVTWKAEKISQNLYLTEGFNIPSDLLSELPTETEFYIQILQGSIASSPKHQMYPLSLSPFTRDNLISNEPSGYFYHSRNFSPVNQIAAFKTYFDIFSYTFSILLSPLLDRANYITIPETNDFFLIENRERVCNEHLEAIKWTLPQEKWEEFDKHVNFDQFAQSDSKSVKYHVKDSKGYISYNFEILYRIDIFLNEKNWPQISKSNSYAISDTLSTYGYLKGIRFNFDNFEFIRNVQIKDPKISEEIHRKQKRFIIHELLPLKLLTPIYSTWTIKVYFNDNLLKIIPAEDIGNYFNVRILDKFEKQYPEVPYPYDNRENHQLIIEYVKDLSKFDRIEISMEFRKVMIEFESLDNNEEFGYIFPNGWIVLGDQFTITNSIYFNMPNIDITMPFNMIAVCWVVYGFLMVQILNIFLGERNNLGIIGTLKARFLAKWGFLFPQK